MKNKKVLTLTLASMLAFSACVDKNYDLADVDTDEIKVGDNIVAPLGSGSIEASKLLDKDNVKEIKVDDDGNYLIVYEDELDVSMPKAQDVKLEDIRVKINSIAIPDELPSLVEIPVALEVPLNATQTSLDFELPKEITRLDYVEFEESDRKAVFYLDIRARDFSLYQGNADVSFVVTFPEKFELVSLTSQYNSRVEGNVYSCKLPLSELQQGIRLPIKIKKAINGTITIASVIHADAGTRIYKGTSPALYLEGNFTALDYSVVYGAFNIKFNVDPSTLDMGDFSNIFEGDDNYLSFTDPHVKLNTVSNVGIPLEGVLSLSTENNKGVSKKTTIPGINILPSPAPGKVKENNIWIGGENTQIQPDYTLVENKDLQEIIAISPNRAFFAMKVGVPETSQPQFFTKDAAAKVKYQVEIPFAVTKDFRSNVTEMIEGAFDEDLVDYVFQDGTATISGDVKNTVPLDIEMNLIIVDENGSPVGIDLEPKKVAGSPDGKVVTSQVSYTIEERDMHKMATAKDIKVLLTITSSQELAGKNLKEGQKLELELKLAKTGGITINSKDDNN